MHDESHLTKIALTLRRMRTGLGPAEGGQHESCKECNDCDHEQQLDKRESAAMDSAGGTEHSQTGLGIAEILGLHGKTKKVTSLYRFVKCPDLRPYGLLGSLR